MLLGFTAGTGIACTEIKESAISKALGVIGGWFSEIFKSDRSVATSQEPHTPLDPIAPLIGAWGSLAETAKTVVNLVPQGYTWINNGDNSKWILGFFKSFWDYSFVKNVVFNFHLTVRAWLGVLFDSNALSKFPNAIKKFQSLAKFLSEEGRQNGDKNMINWLYLRFFVNPRRTLNVLARGQKTNNKEGNEGLKCNGQKKKPKKQTGENLPLGVCFVCSDGKNLITQITEFLKEGKIPPIATEKK